MFPRAFSSFAAIPQARQAMSRFVRMNATDSKSRLANKVAVVTASTEGIGFAIARRLAQDGAHVVLSSRKKANVDRAVAELQTENLSVSGLVCHVGKAEDRKRLIETAVERHGGIDILVSNAAVNPYFGSILDTPGEVWDKILDINVKAAAMLVQSVVPHMEKRGGGAIVLVSSIAAYSPFPGLGPYNVSKTALLGLVRNFVPELSSRKIRINCLAPGLIETKFSLALREDEATLEKTMESLRIQRIGVPSDCSGIVSFLCSPDADYITGETIVVAGGAPSRL
ncbi:dehydrogenase/reductase SDR family member 4 isoform X1 [Anolis carolinensis]|nr:PREDICTED: dehydrogenase/reductase SDR family member 4 isoform X1 [Anolis carolinensis]XP_008121547.1 PREDICTED: dehydrogenase/reductase SDR family member 4 isoform X1 [Anolis carolinensis]|eukprot:XP_008121546.1 PREDICTED: dehydrogenase/reductase SDR family member 4 isoform X1 [Anolis carolinensis]